MTGSGMSAPTSPTVPTGAGTSSTSGKSSSTKHWTLSAAVEMNKFSPYYGRLGSKLSESNYTAWSRIAETALRSISVFEYCDGTLSKPADRDEARYWVQADLLVQSLLLTNMEDSIISQLDQGISSAR